MFGQDFKIIDHTVQVTQEWIGEVRDRVGWDSSRDAMRLMRAVLTELRDRLSHADVAVLAAQMPPLSGTCTMGAGIRPRPR